MVDGILNIKSIQSNFHVSHICNKGNKLPKCHTIAIKKKVIKMSHNCNQKKSYQNVSQLQPKNKNKKTCKVDTVLKLYINPYSAFQREVFINSYH